MQHRDPYVSQSYLRHAEEQEERRKRGKAGKEGSSASTTASTCIRADTRWRAATQTHHARSACARPTRRMGPEADAEWPPESECSGKSSTDGSAHSHARMPSLRTGRGLAELQSGREREGSGDIAHRRRMPRAALRETQRDGSAPRLDDAEVLRPTGIRREEASSVARLRGRYGRVVATGSGEGPNDRETARELRLREYRNA